MMLKVKNAIEDIVEKYSDDHRFINDHELNVVCQIDTDEERIEFILAEIDEQLPAGIYFNHEYTCGEYEITFKEIKGADIMNEYEVKMTLLTAAIENEFEPLDWADITVYKEEGTGNITFTGPTLSERDWKPGAFKGAEDAFFAKVRRITAMIQNCGYTASMVRFEADKLCPYSEATIEINFEGGEL